MKNLHAVVFSIRDDDVLPAVDGDALEPLELAREAAPLPEGPDLLAVGREHLDAVVTAVRHVHVVRVVQRDAPEEEEEPMATKGKENKQMPAVP